MALIQRRVSTQDAMRIKRVFVDQVIAESYVEQAAAEEWLKHLSLAFLEVVSHIRTKQVRRQHGMQWTGASY